MVNLLITCAVWSNCLLDNENNIDLHTYFYGSYLARVVFGSVSALSSSFVHCDLWMVKRKRNQKMVKRKRKQKMVKRKRKQKMVKRKRKQKLLCQALSWIIVLNCDREGWWHCYTCIHNKHNVEISCYKRGRFPRTLVNNSSLFLQPEKRDFKWPQIVFEIEIEIAVKKYSRYLNQQYSSRCLHLAFVNTATWEYSLYLTVFQAAMFTNTKCKHLLECCQFKYLLYFCVRSQTQSEAVRIDRKNSLCCWFSFFFCFFKVHTCLSAIYLSFHKGLFPLSKSEGFYWMFTVTKCESYNAYHSAIEVSTTRVH